MRHIDHAGRELGAQLHGGRDRPLVRQRDDLLLDDLADARQLGGPALARQPQHRDGRVAHRLGGVPVGDDAVERGAVELAQVTQLVERGGNIAVRWIRHLWCVNVAARRRGVAVDGREGGWGLAPLGVRGAGQPRPDPDRGVSYPVRQRGAIPAFRVARRARAGFRLVTRHDPAPAARRGTNAGICPVRGARGGPGAAVPSARPIPPAIARCPAILSEVIVQTPKEPTWPTCQT